MSETPPQQPPSAPPPASSPDPYGLGPTSMGMAPHLAAAISYVFGWITGLIFFLSEKQNKFVRFHAMQSILLSAAYTVIYIIVGMLLVPMVFAATFGGIWMLLNLLWIAMIGLAILCIVMAAQGKWFKLPIIGDIAEKQSNPVA